MDMESNRVIKIGNCSTGNSEGGMVYSVNGVFAVITAGVHGYGMGNILIIEEDNDVTDNKSR